MLYKFYWTNLRVNSNQSMVLKYLQYEPEIAANAYIAPNATVIGRTKIGEDSSVWFQTVIRGDVESISIGRRTNIQDLSMIHVTSDRFATRVGDDVTVGHKVLLHGCVVEDNCLIGMGSILMDGVLIRKNTIVGAGSLVTPGKEFPEGVLIKGSPAKVARDLTEKEIADIKASADHYCKVAASYRDQASD